MTNSAAATVSAPIPESPATPAINPRTRALLEAPITPLLLKLAAPNIAVMLAQSAVGVIETYFVGKLGTDALAGVSLVFPVLMLMQMMSAGAMGGGISSAIARALGARRPQDAQALILHAVVIALGMGLVFTAAVLAGGPWLYALMGGRGGSLAAALTYSGVIFAGSILVWLFNAFGSIIRGTGNMMVPAAISLVGVVVLIPLSPSLILGLGPFPRLGVAGGAVAVLIYYAAGTVVMAFYAASSKAVVRMKLTGIATGLAGRFGAAAIAGYGTGARLEYLLTPLVFGLGAPLVTMVGTNIGAGKRERALKTAWTGALISAAACEVIGLLATAFPTAWLTLFDSDPAMLSAGTAYLHTVGPFYGFYGLALSLYFCSQGAGRLLWPLIGNAMRLLIAAGGGWLALVWTGDLGALFVAQGIALAASGINNATAVKLGVWFKRRPA